MSKKPFFSLGISSILSSFLCQISKRFQSALNSCVLHYLGFFPLSLSTPIFRHILIWIYRSLNKNAISLIQSSSLFDSEWYYDHYTEVKAEGIDPVVHYLLMGWKKMYNPGPEFCSASYIESKSGHWDWSQNPLVHYELVGRPSHANPSPTWDEISSLFHARFDHEETQQKGVENFNHSSLNDRFPLETILFIGHDASGTGAPRVLLNILRWLDRNTNLRLFLILLDGGPLVDSYKEVAQVWCLHPSVDPCIQSIRSFCPEPDLIYGNTVIAAKIYPKLIEMEVPIITHVHEMEYVLLRVISRSIRNILLRDSSWIIAASEPVAENLVKNHHYNSSHITVIYDFIELSVEDIPDHTSFSVKGERKKKIVLGCGRGSWRKGIDLFVDVANKVIHSRNEQDVYFIWVGEIINERLLRDPLRLAAQYGIERHLIFTGYTPYPRTYFSTADIFLLPSREDPFPLVALEACEQGLPIICFDKSGGMPEFIRTGPGVVVPFEDADAMAEEILSLLSDDQRRIALGMKARERLLESHTSEIAVPAILDVCLQVVCQNMSST